MRRLCAILALAAVAAAPHSRASDTIEPGDVLLLKAKIVNCDTPARAIDYVEVPRSGTVVFFERFTAPENVRLSTHGRTASQLAGELADELEARNGYRPRTIEIVVLSGRDIIAAKEELLEAASRKLFIPCGYWRPQWRPDPNRNEVPDLPPLETRNLALEQTPKPAAGTTKRSLRASL